MSTIYLSPSELAARHRVGVGHLANLRSQGTGLPYVKTGGRVLYRLEDVELYEAAHYVQPLDAP